jgi:hypothetical protein
VWNREKRVKGEGRRGRKKKQRGERKKWQTKERGE